MNNKAIIYSRWFRVSKGCRFKNGKAHGKPVYVLSLQFSYVGPNMVRLIDFQEAVRDVVDPCRSRSGKHGTSWKYDSKTKVEQDYLLLTLKWGS